MTLLHTILINCCNKETPDKRGNPVILRYKTYLEPLKLNKILNGPESHLYVKVSL